MNNQITYYNRDTLGKFKKFNFKKTSKKIIIYQLILLSLVTNIFLARMIWNVRCEVNGHTVGYFTTKETCGNLNDQWFASTQTMIISNDQTILANNPDLR